MCQPYAEWERYLKAIGAPQVNVRRGYMCNRNQITIQAAEMANETARIKVKLDTDRDTVYAQTEVQRVQVEHNAKMMELQLKRELAIMESASREARYSSRHCSTSPCSSTSPASAKT